MHAVSPACFLLLLCKIIPDFFPLSNTLFVMFDYQVDDGSDQDYDSHIMVWQLPCSEARPPTNQPPMTTNPTNQTLSIATPTSTTSSSIDLAAHTPGSGVVTVDSDGDDEREDQSVIELAVDAAESACDSYANWNKDVQSMLDRVGTNTNPPSEEDDDDDDDHKEESVGTNNSPKEDFSQHINTSQAMPGR